MASTHWQLKWYHSDLHVASLQGFVSHNNERTSYVFKHSLAPIYSSMDDDMAKLMPKPSVRMAYTRQQINLRAMLSTGQASKPLDDWGVRERRHVHVHRQTRTKRPYSKCWVILMRPQRIYTSTVLYLFCTSATGVFNCVLIAQLPQRF